ncbi:hypothetical protein [Streptomyces sp. NPDC093261]|uniref:hypothetical protein n=1 Tax=Streptomyces sp. NPDC093261 TaxID=3366037 RepID=UPI0037FABF42
MDATPPERPPRPDEDLIRFHNGDTLDNIPIVRLASRRPWKGIALGAVAVLALGACVAALVMHAGSKRPAVAATALGAVKSSAASSPPPSRRPSPIPSPTPSPTRPAAAAAASASPACIKVHFKGAQGDVSCQPVSAVCEDGAPYYHAQIDELCGGPPTLQTVHLISQPPTGGDPGSTYCIAFTGSSTDTGRDGVLLMNAAHYQCGADIVLPSGQVSDAQGDSVFSNSAPSCTPDMPDTRMTYPAVLDFSALASGTAPEFVCLVANVGA